MRHAQGEGPGSAKGGRFRSSYLRILGQSREDHLKSQTLVVTFDVGRVGREVVCEVIGEVAGILDRVLLRLASYLEKADTLKRKVQFAMLYPGLILTVSMGAILFFLTAIVPTFAEMYADFGKFAPGPQFWGGRDE